MSPGLLARRRPCLGGRITGRSALTLSGPVADPRPMSPVRCSLAAAVARFLEARHRPGLFAAPSWTLSAAQRGTPWHARDVTHQFEGDFAQRASSPLRLRHRDQDSVGRAFTSRFVADSSIRPGGELVKHGIGWSCSRGSTAVDPGPRRSPSRQVDIELVGHVSRSALGNRLADELRSPLSGLSFPGVGSASATKARGPLPMLLKQR